MASDMASVKALDHRPVRCPGRCATHPTPPSNATDRSAAPKGTATGCRTQEDTAEPARTPRDRADIPRPLLGCQPPAFTCDAVDQPPLRRPQGSWGTCREKEGRRSPMSRHQTPFGMAASQLYDGGDGHRIRKETHNNRTLVRRFR